MRVRRLGEGSSNITYDYKNSSIENNFLMKFQNFCQKHFLVTLYKYINDACHLACNNRPSTHIKKWKRFLLYYLKNLVLRIMSLHGKKELRPKNWKLWFCAIPMCKTKPSCDEETSYPLTHLWFTLLELINQSVRHHKATRGIYQSVFSTFESQYLFVNHLWLYFYLLATHV